jgi:MFS family permease
MVVSVIAAFGLGRLIAYPFAGPVSDHFGRKVSGTIGIGLYVIFFIGIITVNSFWAAYLIGILNGMANSFLDTCVSPSLMEMFPESASIANLLTKFAVVTAQLFCRSSLAALRRLACHFGRSSSSAAWRWLPMPLPLSFSHFLSGKNHS